MRSNQFILSFIYDKFANLMRYLKFLSIITFEITVIYYLY